MTGGAVVPEAVVEEWQKQMTVSLPSFYRKWSDVRQPRSRRQRALMRVYLWLWDFRYRLAHAIFPFSEERE